MFFEKNAVLKVLKEMDLTINQFLFLWLRLHDTVSGYAQLLEYHREISKFTTAELDDLVAKGWMYYDEVAARQDQKALNKADYRYIIDRYMLTEKGYDFLYLRTDLAGKELWDTYPMEIWLDKHTVPAKTCDLDELSKTYVKAIHGNKDTHKHVMDVLTKAKQQALITVGIEKFVKSRYWEYLETKLQTTKTKEDELI